MGTKLCPKCGWTYEVHGNGEHQCLSLIRFRFVESMFEKQCLQISRDHGKSWEDADSFTAQIAADTLNGEGVTF